MPSLARQAFLRDHVALQAAVQEPIVANPDDVGALLRRGLTVAGFNLLEGFMEARLSELATFVNSGVVQFLDLPDKLQRKAMRGTIEVAYGRSRRGDVDTAELRTLSQSVGNSLSAVGPGLRLSPFTWMWSGSNLKVEDFREILGSFHVKKPWETTASILDRAGLGPMDVQSALQEIARERHRSAHVSLHSVTTLWLRSLPATVFSLAFAWDSLASVGAAHLRSGSTAFLGDNKFVTDDLVKIRSVVERKNDLAEFEEGKRRAVRRHKDLDALWTLAADACSASEVLVRRKTNSPIDLWTVPVVG